jgi:hypothetical protein
MEVVLSRSFGNYVNYVGIENGRKRERRAAEKGHLALEIWAFAFREAFEALYQ